MSTISEEAVKVAADWLPHSGDCQVLPGRDCTCRQPRVDLMRAALEAAAPHMLNLAKLEAHDAVEEVLKHRAILARLRNYAKNIAGGDMPPFTPAGVKAIGRNILTILDQP